MNPEQDEVIIGEVKVERQDWQGDRITINGRNMENVLRDYEGDKVQITIKKLT